MASLPFPGTWPDDLMLSGNSDYVYSEDAGGSHLWLVGEAIGGNPTIYHSIDHGATFTAAAVLPGPVGVGIGFDPALAIGPGGKLHIIGQTMAGGLVQVVKFQFDTATSRFTGPITLSTTGILSGDYDIVALASGNTYVVASVLNAERETFTGIELDITDNVVATDTLLAAEEMLAGNRFGSLSLWSEDGATVEVYVCAIPKAFTFADAIGQVLTVTRTGPGQVSSPSTLTSFAMRYESRKTTVIGSGDARYLVQGYYSQRGLTLFGNVLLGFRATAGGPWVFSSTMGDASRSYLEPTLFVSDSGAILAAMIGDQAKVSTGLPVELFDVNPLNGKLSPRTDFPFPVQAVWLRGTKSLLSFDMPWGLMIQEVGEFSRFYTGYSVPPVALLTPASVSTGTRDAVYTFDGSQSYSPNMRELRYEWTLAPTGIATLEANGGTATVKVPASAGHPEELLFTLTMSVTDYDTLGDSLHAAVTATAAIDYPAIAAPGIAPAAPIAAARNAVVGIQALPSVSPYTSPSFSWAQTAGTPVAILSAPNLDSLTIGTSGALIGGETLGFTLTVNDGINPPVSGVFEVIVPARTLPGVTGVLARSTYNGAISERNALGTWAPAVQSGQPSDFISYKRGSLFPKNYPFASNYLRGLQVPPVWTSTVAQQSGSVLFIGPETVTVSRWGEVWGVLTPDPADMIRDAVHAFADETIVLTGSQKLMRFTPASPAETTDNAGATIRIGEYSTAIFTRMIATPPSAGRRVIALLGNSGILFLQINSAFKVTSSLGLMAGSHTLYGAAEVVWARLVDVEDLHSGNAFIGTTDGLGSYFETEYSLASRRVTGVLDALDLQNKIPATGELLFEAVDTYSGHPMPAALSGMVSDSRHLALSWAQDRSDLVSGYIVCMSINGGGFLPYRTIASGLVLSYLVPKPIQTGTVAFCLVTVTPDGNSAPSNVVSFAF